MTSARPLASQQFPVRKRAIIVASDRGELVRAAFAFAFAAMFVRRVTGFAMELSHEAVSAEIASYARQSKVRGRMPSRYVARMVSLADVAAGRALDA